MQTVTVVQLVRTLSIMRVVMSSSPDWSEFIFIFHITYDSWVVIEVWVSGSKPTLIRCSALVQQLSVSKDPRCYTLSEAWSGVNWADLMAAQGAFGIDFYDDSRHDALDGVL